MDKYSDLVQKGHPEFNDEQLYQRARLVTAAVLAKIHTIDWTTQLLKNNVLLAAMRINWYYLYTYICSTLLTCRLLNQECILARLLEQNNLQ